MPSPLFNLSHDHVAGLLNPTLDLIRTRGTIDAAAHDAWISRVWDEYGMPDLNPRAAAYGAGVRFVLDMGGYIQRSGDGSWVPAPGPARAIRDPLALVKAAVALVDDRDTTDCAPVPQPVRPVEQALRDALQRLRDAFHSERHVVWHDRTFGGRSGTVKPGSPPRSAPGFERMPAAPETAAPAPADRRFPDFRILAAGSGAEHPHDRPLKADQEYVLEVTITPDPRGLPATGDRQPVREPGQAETVKVFVTAEADDESFVHIHQPLDSLHLPPGSGASTAAYFAFRPKRKSAGPGDRAAIMVRMYYRLNLLARTVVSFEISGRFDDVRRDGAVTVHPQVLDPTLAALDEVVPQDLHIDVTSRSDDGYRLNVLYRRPGGEDVVFPARLRITTAGLEDRLRDTRDELHRITSSPEYTTGLQATPDQFAAHLHRLARTGRRLWSKLFDEDLDAAAFDLAAVLHENPPPPGGRIQVTLAPDATEFIFPWGLVFQGKIPEESYVPPDTDGFWGTRYEVEIRLPQSPLPRDRPAEVPGALKLAFMLWDRFPNSSGQKEFIADLEARSGGRLDVGEPILRASLCKALLADCDAQVLYFYSHGHTRPRKADTRPDGGPQAPDADRDRTWIALTNGKLYLDDLVHEVQGTFPSQPLIVLNMCESAEMSPSLSDSFVSFFLDRGARAVVGTECPMTVEFADPFGRRLLEGVLAGQTASRALMEARRHFVRNERNPLGLAYTLYGTASVSFAPPVLSQP